MYMACELERLKLGSVAQECTSHVIQVVHPRRVLGCANVGVENVQRVELCELGAVVYPFDDSEEWCEAMVLAAAQRTVGALHFRMIVTTGHVEGAFQTEECVHVLRSRVGDAGRQNFIAMFDRRVRQPVWKAELKLSQLLAIAVFGVDAVRLRRDVGNDGASLETDLHNLQVAEGNVDV